MWIEFQKMVLSLTNVLSFTDTNSRRRQPDVRLTGYMAHNHENTALRLTIDDDVYENTDERFQLVITSTSNSNVLIGTKNKTTVNIKDDEMITVFFQEDTFSFSESDGEAVVTVYADLPSGGLAFNITLGVNITNGTATSKKQVVGFCAMFVHTYIGYERQISFPSTQYP